MSLTITQLFEKADAQEESDLIAYIWDKPIHYIVLKREDNTLTLEFLHEFIATLDKIEATKGAGVVVTIGTGKKSFSTGFDLPTWVGEPETFMPGNELIVKLMDRLIRLSLPSMCVFNGHAMAGGYFFGICHDFRTMKNHKGRICLTELMFGEPLHRPLTASLEQKLAPQVVHKLVMAQMISPQEALADRIIDDIYSDDH